MITDQRYNPRVSFFMGGDIYKNPRGEKIGRTIIRDLSLSGMRIETLDGLDLNQTVYVDFEVAGKFRFEKVPARVTRIFRHSGVFLAGLCFLDGHDKRRIRQALCFVLEDRI
jgi:hypothetical protein